MTSKLHKSAIVAYSIVISSQIIITNSKFFFRSLSGQNPSFRKKKNQKVPEWQKNYSFSGLSKCVTRSGRRNTSARAPKPTRFARVRLLFQVEKKREKNTFQNCKKKTRNRQKLEKLEKLGIFKISGTFFRVMSLQLYLFST